MTAELICGSFLILGLLTRAATVPLIIDHARRAAVRSCPTWIFPARTGCEYVLLLLAALMAIRTLGPGEASMDNAVGGRRR